MLVFSAYSTFAQSFEEDYKKFFQKLERKSDLGIKTKVKVLQKGMEVYSTQVEYYMSGSTFKTVMEGTILIQNDTLQVACDKNERIVAVTRLNKGQSLKIPKRDSKKIAKIMEEFFQVQDTTGIKASLISKTTKSRAYQFITPDYEYFNITFDVVSGLMTKIEYKDMNAQEVEVDYEFVLNNETLKTEVNIFEYIGFTTTGEIYLKASYKTYDLTIN